MITLEDISKIIPFKRPSEHARANAAQAAVLLEAERNDAARDARELQVQVDSAFQDLLNAVTVESQAQANVTVAHNRYTRLVRQLETAKVLLGVRRG